MSISFGPPAAENDDDLLDYFHVTKQVKELTDFSEPTNIFIYVARQGGGKTALLKWFESNQDDIFRIIITNENTRLYAEDDQLTTGDLELLMRSELTAYIISRLHDDGRCPNADLADRAEKFVTGGWPKKVLRFLKEKFVGISILGCGFNLKPDERKEYLQAIRSGDRIAKGEKLLKELATNVPILTVLDNPEAVVGKGLDTTSKEDGKRVGTLLKVLARIHAKRVRVVAFVRENILQNTREHFADYQHFADQIKGVEWTDEDLISVIKERIEKRLHSRWKDVFNFGEDALRKQVFPLLLSGPRDLIRLSNQAGEDKESIGIKDYIEVFDTYAANNWRDLDVYYGEQWPEIGNFAKIMIEELNAKFDKDRIPKGKVNDLFKDLYSDPDSQILTLRQKPECEWIDQTRYESPSAAERLFIVGCLGYYVGRKKHYPWNDRNLGKYNKSSKYFVSEAFRS